MEQGVLVENWGVGVGWLAWGPSGVCLGLAWGPSGACLGYVWAIKFVGWGQPWGCWRAAGGTGEPQRRL